MNIPTRIKKPTMTPEERLERYGDNRMTDEKSKLLGDNIALFYAAMKSMKLDYLSYTDVGYDILLAVCKNMNNFDPARSSLSSYIYNLVRWFAWNCIKADRRKLKHFPMLIDDYNSFHEPLTVEEPRYVLSGALGDVLATLKPAYARLIEQRFVYEYSMQYIADELGVSKQRVEQKIDQVLDLIKKRMAEKIRNYKDYE